jgi:hypothetical protein
VVVVVEQLRVRVLMQGKQERKRTKTGSESNYELSVPPAFGSPSSCYCSSHPPNTCRSLSLSLVVVVVVVVVDAIGFS